MGLLLVPTTVGFELPDRSLGERRIAVQVIGVQDRAHVAQAVAGDGGDLRLSAHPTIASRVTAVPRRSWKVTPTIPALRIAMPHAAWKLCDAHGRRRLLVRISGPCFLAASSADFSGAPTGITTRTGRRAPPLRMLLRCTRRMTEPS